MSDDAAPVNPHRFSWIVRGTFDGVGVSIPVLTVDERAVSAMRQAEREQAGFRAERATLAARPASQPSLTLTMQGGLL